MARTYNFTPLCFDNDKFLETRDPFNIALTICHDTPSQIYLSIKFRWLSVVLHNTLDRFSGNT